jgi:hypothetical protein
MASGPADETTIVLRQGRAGTPVSDREVKWLIYPAFGLVLVTVLLVIRFDLPMALLWLVVFGVPVIMVVTLIWKALARGGRPSTTVVISRLEVKVRYGEEAELGSEPPAHSRDRAWRTQVDSIKVGARFAIFRDAAGKRVIYVPLRPKRDLVLNELRRHGWPVPVVNGFGGLIRH